MSRRRLSVLTTQLGWVFPIKYQIIDAHENLVGLHVVEDDTVRWISSHPEVAWVDNGPGEWAHIYPERLGKTLLTLKFKTADGRVLVNRLRVEVVKKPRIQRTR